EQVDLRWFYAGVFTWRGQRRCDTGGVRHSVVKKLAHQAHSPGGPGYLSARVALLYDPADRLWKADAEIVVRRRD
ncbi:hypothetical protein CEJ63_20260, partial [Acinetobacter baumannii]